MRKIAFLIISLTLALQMGCQKRAAQPFESVMAQGTPVSSAHEVESVPSIAPEVVSVGETLPAEAVEVSSASKPEETFKPRVFISFDDLEKMSVDYEVKMDESLSQIAARADIGVGLLMRLNHIMDANLIRFGQKLKILQGPFKILIHKNDKTLSIYLKDQIVKTFDVAVGKSNSTPEGQFKVMNKMIKPVWTDPHSNLTIKGDEPGYPLGTRWLQFAPDGYGIHGTKNPESIKTEASFGCIRMLNPDVEDLYDYVTIGSEVAVVP